MTKLQILFISIFLVGAMFVGCAKKSDNNSISKLDLTKSGTETKKQSVTITYLSSQDWVTKAEKQLAAKFEKETGIKVEYQIVPSNQYLNLLKAKLNAGECTDLFGSQSGKFDIVSFLNIEKNCVNLSDESWAKRIDPLVAEQLTVNGKLYGITIYDVSSCWVISYNKKIFNELGLKVPTNFEQFKLVCKKIKDSGIIPIYECVSDGWHHVLWFPELGGRFEEVDPGLAEKLNTHHALFAENKTMLKALNQLQEINQLGYFGPNYMSNTFADTEKNMASGKYAMTLFNQGLPRQIEKLFPEVKEDTFGSFVMPLVDNQILNVNPAGPSIFIYSGSKKTEAAKQYVEYLARPENLQFLIDNTDKFNTLPFKGVKGKNVKQVKELYSMFPKQGVVYQTQIKYLNPQWMDIGIDLSEMFTGSLKPVDVLRNIDKRREEAAKAVKDPAWNN
ncbi:MAG: extracellular solute-binding protein [Bacillota bacterium]|nr:extracellular solute-binding protein [Bacillota bacterium]